MSDESDSEYHSVPEDSTDTDNISVANECERPHSDVQLDRNLRRSSRVSRPPGEWWKASQANSAVSSSQSTQELSKPDIRSLKLADIRTPKTVSEAMLSTESGHWYEAMQTEYSQMQAFNAWSLEELELPAGRKAISCKWVFNVKPSLSGDGTVRKFKARFVVRGFSQREGIDYDETFSPVAHAESFRTLLAMAAQYGLYLRQVDVVGAFLNGSIQEDIYMNQPEGFTVKGKENLVCKLKKALYGLKQAGMIWNRELDGFLVTELGFRSQVDPCVYTQSQSHFRCILLIHGDDIIIAHNNLNLCDNLVNNLKQKWDVTDLGEPKRVLGLQLERYGPTGPIFIHQETYINELLLRFNMSSCKTCVTPHQTGHSLPY